MPHHSMIKHRGQGWHEARTRHARRYKWVTIGSRPFDFLGVGGGGKGDFKEEYHVLKTDSQGENSCKEIPGEKNRHWKQSFMEYNAGKKILHRFSQEKILSSEICKKKKEFLHKPNHPYYPLPPQNRVK